MYLGKNPHGTRVIQKIIENFKTDIHAEKFNTSISPYILNLINDVNGNHIVIKYVNVINSKNNQFIYDIINKNLLEIASNKHGCCVLQKCIENASSYQKKNLIDEVINNTENLMCDTYGNYVIQYIIALKDQSINYKIANKFKKNITYLSKQKFSSNVIEKVI